MVLYDQLSIYIFMKHDWYVDTRIHKKICKSDIHVQFNQN